MNRFPASSCALAASALALGLTANHADAALLDVDFDNTAASNAYSYSYTQSPGTIAHSHAVVAGAGVEGSNALRATEDATNAQAYWGIAFVIEQTLQPPLTLSSLDELYYSFDMAAQGGLAPTTNLRVTVRFHDGSNLLELRDSVGFDTTNSSFQTISGGLPTVINGSLANLLDSTNPITIRVSAEFTSAAGGFGYDDGNVFVIDNIEVGVVPEPASLALLGAAGVLALRRRRV